MVILSSLHVFIALLCHFRFWFELNKQFVVSPTSDAVSLSNVYELMRN